MFVEQPLASPGSAKNSIPFLDTSISIEDGEIVVDLYKKPTDKNQYLLPNSCHPRETTKSIPFSLALRITRICSKPHTRDIRFQELKNMLLERNYSSGMIDASIRRARAISREKAQGGQAKPTQETCLCSILGSLTARSVKNSVKALEIHDPLFTLHEGGFS